MHSNTVDFAHRTVYDFVLTADMQLLLNQQVPPHFHSPEFYPHILLARLKVIHAYLKSENLCKYYTTFVDQVWISGRHPTSTLILAEIDRIACAYPLRVCKKPAPETSRSPSPLEHIYPSAPQDALEWVEFQAVNQEQKPRRRKVIDRTDRSAERHQMQDHVTACQVIRLLNHLICNHRHDSTLKLTLSLDLVNKLIFSALGVSSSVTGTPFAPEQININLVNSLLQSRANPDAQAGQFKATNRST